MPLIWEEGQTIFWTLNRQIQAHCIYIHNTNKILGWDLILDSKFWKSVSDLFHIKDNDGKSIPSTGYSADSLEKVFVSPPLFSVSAVVFVSIEYLRY